MTDLQNIMLGKKKKSTELTFVAQGTKLSGESLFTGETLISGEIYGKVNSTGKITIESDGYIEGELNCDELKVSGNFKGELNCEKLYITSTGTVEGKVSCESMEIFKGGQFIGMRIKEDITLLNTAPLSEGNHIELKADIQAEFKTD